MVPPRPSVTASSGPGRAPKLRLPGHPPDTAPKGVETHPGDGCLSVGSTSMRLFHIYHAKRAYPAVLPILKEGRRPARVIRKPDRFSPSDQHTDRHTTPAIVRGRKFNTIRRIAPRIAACGPSSQKLESSFEKYGLSRPEVNCPIGETPFCKSSRLLHKPSDRKNDSC
jgi:hypothetical protein